MSHLVAADSPSSSTAGSRSGSGSGNRAHRRSDLPEALNRALDVAVEKQARAPVVLSVTDITGYTDWVLIVSGRSERHVAGITDAIARELRTGGERPRGTDGYGDHTWDLLDYDDFMIHVFQHPTRTHYDLESMWSDAKRVELELPADVMSTEGLEVDIPIAVPEYRGDGVFGGYDDEFDDDAEDHDAPADDDGDFDDTFDDFDGDGDEGDDDGDFEDDSPPRTPPPESSDP